MAILLTGGSGTTAKRIARLLQEKSVPVILTSRNVSSSSSDSSTTVKFDWFDSATFEAPFTTSLGSVASVYLVSPPGVFDVLSVMKPFIDLAKSKGVKRFVLLSGGTAEPGGSLPSAQVTGKVHEYLLALGVDYCVIRPSWFLENFIAFHAHTIKASNEIISATGDGKAGFLSADNIAELAVDALTVEKSYNTDFIIVGPELLSYDEIAEIFTSVLGRPIKHKRITADALKKMYTGFGIPDDYAAFLTWLQTWTAEGGEVKVFKETSAEKRKTAKKTVKQFIEENKGVWAV